MTKVRRATESKNMKSLSLNAFLRILSSGGLMFFLASCSMPEPRKSQALTHRQILEAYHAEAETVETRLTKLFDICKSGDTDAAAAYFVYRGPDKSREWKDTYRASDPFEKAEVKDICLRIKGYLDESERYQFGAVKVERESEGEWHALEVSFQQGGEVKKVTFAFLQIKGQFAIGDIDE